MSEILQKKRGNGGARAPGYRGSSISNLSNKGRVISGRVPSKSKRIVSKGDLFTQGADANSSFGEEAIDFDLNKNTILSNFEEWIKLSADNKITSKNSWQFALIDYFHDLNVIKDGENINFQRASATLDGCVKIYSSRVESVATETGKLLSGLANKKKDEQDDDDDEGTGETADGDAQDEAKKKRKATRPAQSILVSFDSIRIKKLDQELAIDPLFKKALSEFDEGGAKSLLLNTLSIDSSGRVVFDATTAGPKVEEAVLEEVDNSSSIDMGKLKNMVFKEPGTLDNLTICPSMDQLKVVLQDIDKAKSVLTDVNNQFLYSNNEEEVEANSTKLEEQAFDFGNYDDNDFNDDANFGDDNGDGNANRSILDNLLEEKEKEAQKEEYELVPSAKVLDRDLMAYFDETMKSNWRGPEHWKVAAYKKSKNLTADSAKQLKESTPGASANPVPKKVKEETFINFFDEEEVDEDKLFEAAVNPIVKKENTAETKLPEDIQYNSTRLINLFLKPHIAIVFHSKVPKGKAQDNVLTDENFFADQYNEQTEQDRMTSFHQAQFDEINHDYDNDDGDVFGGIDFNDVLENDQDGGADARPNGASLITGGRKVRPDYVNFSRIAKRVDIRLLKNNLWKCLNEEQPQSTPVKTEPSVKPEITKGFGSVISSIGKLYGAEEKKDLSTSFCFICLLHLANEHGLSVASNDDHDDLLISGF